MESISLNNQNSEFKILGQEETMSVEILKVILHDTGNQDLKIEVVDENGFLLYAKKLVPEPKHPNAVHEGPHPEVGVNKRFIFSSFITVKMEASAGKEFQVEVYYV